MRCLIFLLAGVAWGSIVNECSIVRGDGTRDPCDTSKVSYGSMFWGGTVGPDDRVAEYNVGYSQSLTFTGPPTGTKGYIAMYAYDLFTQASIDSGGSMASFVSSNLPLTRTWDNSSQFLYPDSDTMIPITFGKPLAFEVGVNAVTASHPEGNQYFSGSFLLLQINVYGPEQNLLAEIKTPTVESAEIQVPAHAPEPATFGLAALSIAGIWWGRRLKSVR